MVSWPALLVASYDNQWVPKIYSNPDGVGIEEIFIICFDKSYTSDVYIIILKMVSYLIFSINLIFNIDLWMTFDILPIGQI